MSWPLASFLVVGVVLAAGWLAYERRRRRRGWRRSWR